MQKQAPSAGRIFIAVGFALSCFGLLLFLWIAFGGPIPLKPKSYRVTAYFPEGTSLAIESDVRIAGVSVGKVKSIELADNDPELKDVFGGQDVSEAEMEIDPRFAPLSTDAKALLRSKTLLGETYVELTSGTEPTDDEMVAAISQGEASAAAGSSDAASIEDGGAIEPIPEDGKLGPEQTREQTQIDEIFNALDDDTRRAFQVWLQRSGIAINGRGLDLNDAFGNLGPFLDDASDLVGILNKQKVALEGIVRDTGEVFEALTERGQVLANLITTSNATFDAIASEDQALTEVIQIFPIFQQETRATFTRLDEFQQNTRPLVRDLLPVANDISPTLRKIRQLSPRLTSLFGDLDRLNAASKTGLPALRKFLDGLRPTLAALDPFLANLNPVVRYLRYNKTTVTDFLGSPPAALSGTLSPLSGQPSARHALRQISYISTETLAVQPSRLPTNRGNGYLQPLSLTDRTAAANGIFPNWDCDPSGGERFAGDGKSPGIGPGFAPCFVTPDYPKRFGGKTFATLTRDP